MDNNLRRRKLKKFNDVYYGDLKNTNLENNFKYNQLPYWMNAYGHYLDMELVNKMPKYYNYFSQGTIIMTDFGINVGSEMSGGHFAIVINSDDSKYKKTLTVLPLTSKFHKNQGQVSLGKELFFETSKLTLQKAAQLQEEVNNLRTDFNTLLDELINPKLPTMTAAEHEILSDFFENTNFLYNNHFNLDENSELYKSLTKLSLLKNINEYSAVKAVINNINFLITKFKYIENKLTEVEYKSNEIYKLNEKLNKYNKNTFVNTSNITTISKLRSKKISEYTISGNVKISQKSINKIKESLLKKME